MDGTKVRILFFIPGGERGGVATAFNALAAALEGQGAKVIAMLPYRTDYECSAVDKKYVKAFAMPRRVKSKILLRFLNLFNVLTGWRFYFRLIPKIEHDIFVVYQGQSFSHWRRYTRKPCFAWFHGVCPLRRMPGLRAWLWDVLHRRDYECFSKLFAITPEVATCWKKRYNFSEVPTVLSNLVDIDRIRILGNARQDVISTDMMVRQLVFVARLAPEKGLLRLLQVIDRLVNEDGNNRFCLWIVGDGPQRCVCETFVSKHGLQNVVHFLGEKVNPYPYIKACDMLVCPSYEEGLGLVLWESLLLNRPVLATACGGTETALRHGEWGRLVDNTVEGLYHGLVDVLGAPERMFPRVTYRAITDELRAMNKETITYL